MPEKMQEKRGYLAEDFRIFDLKDRKAQRVDYHYHDFDKAVLLLSGGVTYLLGESSYSLKPGDLLLVPSGVVHKPIILSSTDYERYVIWISPALYGRYTSADLASCFSYVREGGLASLSLSTGQKAALLSRLSALEELGRGEGFGAEIMYEAGFVQLLVEINRLMGQTAATGKPKHSIKISQILSYLNDNLCDDITVDSLADRFFISRYHLMRRFKKETGHTLWSYISRKRILRAAALLRQDYPVAKAAHESGFGDYTTFLRAFKAMFGISPGVFSRMPARDDIVDE